MTSQEAESKLRAYAKGTNTTIAECEMIRRCVDVLMADVVAAYRRGYAAGREAGHDEHASQSRGQDMGR